VPLLKQTLQAAQTSKWENTDVKIIEPLGWDLKNKESEDNNSATSRMSK